MELNKGREDHPQPISPDEVSREHPAKQIKAQEKIDIKESGLGREQGQMPADEHIDSSFSQIDGDTAQLNEGQPKGKNEANASTETSGYMNDSTSADRDTGNDKGGWEESRTARHK